MNLLIKLGHIGFLCLLLTVQAHSQQNSNNPNGHYFSSFDGTKIYYELSGNGYPILLLHGFMSSSDMWKQTSLYKDLVKNGFKVIVPDLRGNGKSDIPHSDSAYANDAEAKDLMHLMTALKIEQYNVVGYSRGAIIASRLLVMDARAHKGVLGGMGVDFTNPQWPRRKMFARALAGDSIKAMEGVIKSIQARGLDQQALALQQKYQPSTSKAQLKALSQRVLVICGVEDKDNGNAEELSLLMPLSSYAKVPGDHNNAVLSSEFGRIVYEFLREDYLRK